LAIAESQESTAISTSRRWRFIADELNLHNP
jgi:hypothetical protein